MGCAGTKTAESPEVGHITKEVVAGVETTKAEERQKIIAVGDVAARTYWPPFISYAASDWPPDRPLFASYQ